MELREIRTFLQIAQKQSFQKAAEALGYSQAAVTVQIKQLEEELGIHLFDRLGKDGPDSSRGNLLPLCRDDPWHRRRREKAVSASTELSGDPHHRNH